MAINTDFTINRATGDIVYTGPKTGGVSVIELHRWLKKQWTLDHEYAEFEDEFNNWFMAYS